MYKLLIVDDEIEVREGIKSLISWEENNIIVVGEACNGSDALEVINRTFPDVVLVDIRMPIMNGLQLIKALSNIHPYIKCIIFSGYEDFEYARTALVYGAVDYLLKPSRPEEILKSVQSAISIVEKEKGQNKYHELLPFMKNNYLSALISNNFSDELMLLKSDLFNLKITLNDLRALVIRIDTAANSLEKPALKDAGLIEYAVMNISNDIISSEYPCEVFQYNGDIVVLLNSNEEDNIPLPLIDKLKAQVKNLLRTTISIGIGSFCSKIDEIHKSYFQALNAVEFSSFFGVDSTVSFNDIERLHSSDKSYPTAIEKQLLTCIKSGNKEGIHEKLTLFFEFFEKKESTKHYMLASSLALLFSVYHLLIEDNTAGDEILQQIEALGDTDTCVTISILKHRILEIILTASDKINSDKISNKTIERAINYINENYAKDITLESVAKNAYITPSYASMLFKQVLGVNLVDYVNKVRLDKACELLRDPKLKSYEIAYMVGYNDDKYFSQVFKKKLGLTPTQYRETII